MARWKLIEPHYLNVEGERKAEWEYKEISRQNGREIKKRYTVPLHLDPKSPDDWNYRGGPFEDGEIIISDGNNAQPKDIIYKGPVTHGMEPLDDEARAISAEYAKAHPFLEGREEATYSERLLDKFIEQMADAKTAATQQTQTPGFDEVLKAMTAMMEQNNKIISTLVERDLKRKVA